MCKTSLLAEQYRGGGGGWGGVWGDEHESGIRMYVHIHACIHTNGGWTNTYTSIPENKHAPTASELLAIHTFHLKTVRACVRMCM